MFHKNILKLFSEIKFRTRITLDPEEGHKDWFSDFCLIKYRHNNIITRCKSDLKRFQWHARKFIYLKLFAKSMWRTQLERVLTFSLVVFARKVLNNIHLAKHAKQHKNNLCEQEEETKQEIWNKICCEMQSMYISHIAAWVGDKKTLLYTCCSPVVHHLSRGCPVRWHLMWILILVIG